MITFIFVIIGSLSVSALCSLFEACLLSLSHIDIAEIKSKNPKAGALWSGFRANIQKPIAVILIVNTIAHTLGASLSGAYFEQLFGQGWIVAFSLAFSFAMIQWTEILPKTLGVKFNRRIALIGGGPLAVLVRIFMPIVRLVEIINTPFVGKRTKFGESDRTETVREIGVLARHASVEKIISQMQEQIITRTISVTEKTAHDMMIPLADMKVLSSDMSLAGALIEAHIHNHTRFPLVKAHDRSAVVGYVNFKDIVSALRINPSNPSLDGIRRPIALFDENMKFVDIFKKLNSMRQHIAIVTGKDGTPAGMLTVEDLIEEITGELGDEYDVPPDHFYQIDVGRYIAGGGVRMALVNEKTGTAFPDEGLTLNDWLAGHIPGGLRAGEEYSYGTTNFLVKKIRRSCVVEAIIDLSGGSSTAA